MKPAPFSYYRATSVEDAITALSGADGMAAVLAGGQSLVPMLNLRLSPVDHLIDLRPITALSRQEETPEAICYGALTTHAAFEDGAVPDGTNGLMRYAAAHIAYRAVRNRGTLGGALALADPRRRLAYHGGCARCIGHTDRPRRSAIPGHCRICCRALLHSDRRTRNN